MSSWGDTYSRLTPSKKNDAPQIPMKRNMSSLSKNRPTGGGTPLELNDPRAAGTSVSPSGFYSSSSSRLGVGSSQIKNVSTTFKNAPFKNHFRTKDTSPAVSSSFFTKRSTNNKKYEKKKSASEVEAIERRKMDASKERIIIRDSGAERVNAIGSSAGSDLSPSLSAQKRGSTGVPKKFPSPDHDDLFSTLFDKKKGVSKKHIPQRSAKIISDEEEEPSDLVKQTRLLRANDDLEQTMKQSLKKAQALPSQKSISAAMSKSTAASTRSQSPQHGADHIDLPSPLKEPTKERKRISRIIGSDEEEDPPNSSTASKKCKRSEKKTPDLTSKAGRTRSSSGDITSLLSSSSKKAESKRRKATAGKDDIVWDLDDDDELDDIFNTEGSATLAAKKRLEELKKAGKNKKNKEVLDLDEKDIWSVSYKAGRKIKMLGKQLHAGDEDDDFMKTIKSTNVWIPGSQTDELLDVDFDADLSLEFKNNFEEVDEKVNEIKQTRLVKAKYKNEHYNGGLTRRDLESKANQHLDCIPRILDGTVSSIYYTKSKQFMQGSRSTTISNSDYNRDEFSQFSIGFYGIKRQSAIAMLIRKKYTPEIQEASNFNKTIQFWSTDPFTLYVLASEVAMRMAAEELSMDTDEVVELFHKTIDYGKYIADSIPL